MSRRERLKPQRQSGRRRRSSSLMQTAPNFEIPRRMQAVHQPIIPIIGELIRTNPGTISLGQGVVYYGPPPGALDAISGFLGDPSNHKYKAVEGIPPLIEAIENKLQRENGFGTTA